MTSKLKMHSPDLTEDNIAKIAALFPNCISESHDEQGRLKQVVDFDLLRQELSGVIVEGEQERYRLDWVGKKEAILAANAPIAKTLRPSREESVNFDTTENLFIEGDNLDALKLLQENYLGKVKMIYIDPPYNTGKDFIYNDDFAESSDEFFARSQQFDEEGNRLIANTESNGRFHSDWLSMMYSRLKLARNLLTDDGVIFISCDDNEIHNLRKLCDEVFGEKNHVAEFLWKKKSTTSNVKGADVSVQVDYQVCYKKSFDTKLKQRVTSTEHRNYQHKDELGTYRTTGIEKKDSGSYKRETMKFPILGHKPREGKRWQIGLETARELEKKNRFIFDGEKILLKIYDFEDGDTYSAQPNILDFVGSTDSASKLVNSVLFNISELFDNPKPVELVKFFSEISCNKNSIILDFFAGSATTAHAVMQLNAEDGGNRRFIMVQLPEATDEKSEAFKAGYLTIAEISKERIRRAAAKIQTDFADKLPEDWDGGFRVLKVDSTNMKEVYYYPDEVSQSDLLDMVSHIKEDRSGEDLLFQVMLDWGLPLSLPIQERDVDGKKVYFVGEKSSLGYALAACFDELNEAVIQAVAAETPQKFVSVEYAISKDADKTNIKEWFKQLSPETDVKFI